MLSLLYSLTFIISINVSVLPQNDIGVTIRTDLVGIACYCFWHCRVISSHSYLYGQAYLVARCTLHIYWMIG